MTDKLPLWLPSIAGLIAAWVVGWAAKHNLTLDAEQLTLLIIAAYEAVRRYVSSHVNPGDVTKRELVAPDRAKVARIKAGAS